MMTVYPGNENAHNTGRIDRTAQISYRDFEHDKISHTIAAQAASITANIESACGKAVSGIGDSLFNPDDELTREQAAVILSRLAKALGGPLTDALSTFADTVSISYWATIDVGRVQNIGIMSGVGDNTFAPQVKYTHEQSILTIMKIWEWISTETE